VLFVGGLPSTEMQCY